MVWVGEVLDKGRTGINNEMPGRIREVVALRWNNIRELIDERKTVWC